MTFNTKQINMITTANKRTITDAIIARKANFGGTDEKFAIHLGINPSQLSMLLNDNLDQTLSEKKWMDVMRKLNVKLDATPVWQSVKSPVFAYISAQLSHCQQHSVSGFLVDEADLGKSHVAKHYASTTKYAVYVDCSLHKTRTELIRAIAAAHGVDSGGTPNKVFWRLVDYLRTQPASITILDEYGDLRAEAIMETKSLWNATEGFCAWFMMGANGLKRKFEIGLEHDRLGYAELFRRTGSRYQRVSPITGNELQDFKLKQAYMVGRANTNMPDAELMKIVRKTEGSLTRLKLELTKKAA